MWDLIWGAGIMLFGILIGFALSEYKSGMAQMTFQEDRDYDE